MNDRDFREEYVKSAALSLHCTIVYTQVFRQLEHNFRDKQTEFSAVKNQSKV